MSTARRRTALVGAACALASTAGLVASAAPAAAAPSSLLVTGYANPNFSGGQFGTTGPAVASISGTLNDSFSSVGNNSAYGICFYEHANYGGLKFRIGPGEWWATVPSWIDDKISSYAPCNG
ncbi:peptidase inhibitor family I36 protein [Streptomyces sp. NPDC088387]|uniref:peptidase inhibitor family I36 protein n=1 Tax=Streptomyces sp. NPDC088387 TaxID=3365859 RepID=UPI0037F31816